MSKADWDVMPQASDVNVQFIPHEPFEVYSEKYKDHVVMERRDGVIMARFHTHNKPVLWGAASHRALPAALRAISADPENEVLILTGTGDFWVAYGVANDPNVPEATAEQKTEVSLNFFVGDGMPLQDLLVNDMKIPTIAAVNGPGYHLDMALMCDLVICTDDTVMIDVHRWMGFVSGDGVNVAYQETMGGKRANYAMLMGNAVTAQQALDWGMVNEVVTRDRIYDRAWELAAEIMRGGRERRAWRRMTTEIMRKPLKVRLAQDFFGGFAAEMYGYMADKDVSHDDTALMEMWAAAGVTIPKW